MPRRITAITAAKINLGLEVIRRRPDGYHEIRSILQSISVYDRLVWTATGDTFTYTSPDHIDERDDLVARALETAPDRESWSGALTLVKSIPISAGLGGGSSDAALALCVAGADREDEALLHLASGLGSDVPFFLKGGAVLASGTGTDMVALPSARSWLVLVTPDIAIPSKTRTLYQSLRADDFTDGSAVAEIARKLRAGSPLTAAPPNAFSRPLFEYPEVRRAAEGMEKAGAPWVAVSGAGPTLYTLTSGFALAQRIAKRISSEVGRIHIAHTVPESGREQAVRQIADCLRDTSGRR